MLVKRFEEQVRKNPDRLAVKTEQKSLTYRQLNEAATMIAGRILHTCAIAKIQGDNIALLFEHGTDMIVGTIAALKAGKIYVPFDPSYPENRLLNMLEDSEAKLLVTNARNLEKARQLVSANPAAGVYILNIDEVAHILHARVQVTITDTACDVSKDVADLAVDAQNQVSEHNTVHNTGKEATENGVTFDDANNEVAAYGAYTGSNHLSGNLPLKSNNQVDGQDYVHNSNNQTIEQGIALNSNNQVVGQDIVLNPNNRAVGQDVVNLANLVREDDISYLLYTSGSTGKPKGVVQTNTNVAYFIDNYARMLSITENDRLTLFSTFGHDAAVMDIYGGLLTGATLYPLNIKENMNPERLVDWLREEKITVWHSVPTLYRRFATTLQGHEEFPDLRLIVLGGEGIREHDVVLQKKYFPKSTLVNLYGQSESSFNSAQFITADKPFEKIVLGEPLNATKLLLIDEDGKKVAPLRIGEIVVACEHIAKGYWKKEEQTKKVFSAHPKLGRLYWTGDLGRLLLDGSIEFVGRKDFQVKVRGYRIELGEVESQFLKHPAIKEAVVVGREDRDGEMCLCAYYVATTLLKDQEVRELLARELPDYMIPSYMLALESIPMTATGKVDRGALPDLTTAVRSNAEFVAPRNAIEEQLATIWSEILGVENIGIDDDFFSLGGHSLKATTLVSKIFKAMHVELMLGDIFKYPTIRQLAEMIEKSEESIYESLKPLTVEQKHYQVSSAQRRMFVLDQLEPGNITYNMPKVLIVEGAMDKDHLERTVKALMQRHETLRTSFKIVNGEIVQIIHPEANFTVNYLEAEESQVAAVVKEWVQPFDLNRAPLLRVGLIKIGVEKHVLFFDMHHIISDGTSMGILIDEFVQLYVGRELPVLPIQYKDFAAWQNELFTSGIIEKEEQYWLTTFAGEIPVLNLPTDYPRPAMQSFEGAHQTFEIEPELAQKLKALSRNTGTTLYMLLLSAYNLLLAKYSGQEDIVVGSPIAGRAHADLQNLIGIFVNFLPMRNYPAADKQITTFLKEVKANSIKAYENQDYQFEQLVERLNVKRQMDRNPLFDTMFILQNLEPSVMTIEQLRFSAYVNPQTVSKLDLTVSAVEVGEKISLGVEYCTKLFKPATIERLIGHYTNILRAVVENPDQRIAEIDMLSTGEREQILREFNDTSADYARNRTIHELLEERAKSRPDEVAVVFEEQQLTYGEFNAAANQLARLLRNRGVQPESVVAVITTRSLEMLVGIFATLKAGAAYLPIDPDYPQERINYILGDSNAAIALTQKKLVEEGGMVFPCEVICIDDLALYQGDATNLEPVSTPVNLAYIIYTSGSTGKPKGVMVEHLSVGNFIHGMTSQIDFAVHKSILALTTISFDIMALETVLPLTQGLKVVIGNDEHQRDTKALKMVIEKHAIDMLQMTPSRMRMLLNDEQSAICLANVKVIMLGGEALPPALLAELKSLTSARIYNMYGPTETTIWSAVKELTGSRQATSNMLATTDQTTESTKVDTNQNIVDTEITIGRPIANTQIHIISPSNQLQPVGVPGELCIAGEGLARGYWNRPELTAEKFVQNPFVGERMYRTGDLAKWLPNGELEFIGRIDHQVKIRGYRIELGEIETQLMKHPAVREAAVIDRDDNIGGKYLCAYLVGEDELHLPDVKAHLAKELPDYMIPTYFIPLDTLPYTPNGKIDRKALPAPDAGMVSGVEYVAPTTEIETKLIQIWQEVLGIEGIGVNHNFFEIGGNSINIIKVISLISKRMGVHVNMSELFLHPTVAEMAHTMFIENPLQGLECVIRLNRPTEGKKNVFIMHTWEGIVYQYKELAKLLEGEYNIYGIQAKGVVKPAKLPETLDEMVTDYLVEIKTIQPEGPYILAGYCYGNWITYKIVDMLEDRDVPIDRMIMIDENAWMNEKLRRYFTARTIIERPYRTVRTLVRRYITQRRKNPMDYWPSLEEHKKSKPPVVGEIKNERTVRENVNYLCTIGYNPKHIVSVDTYVIKAEENNLRRHTPEDWRRQTYGKIWYTEIPGGHESIFAYPYVEGLAKAFKRALEE